MADKNVVKCPLCGAFAEIENPQLLTALTDPRIREQVEQYVTALLKTPLEELAGVGSNSSGARDFEKQARSWNPCVPMWRRSPKE
jgi:hypothetical protein